VPDGGDQVKVIKPLLQEPETSPAILPGEVTTGGLVTVKLPDSPVPALFTALTVSVCESAYTE
jgi:hypothetical protein